MLRISLGITRRLALQALQADPASYRECGEIMRRVWGIIIVAGRWQVFLMYAALDEGGERRREQGEMEERWSRSEGGTGHGAQGGHAAQEADRLAIKVDRCKLALDWHDYVSNHIVVPFLPGATSSPQTPHPPTHMFLGSSHNAKETADISCFVRFPLGQNPPFR